ncbi:MAG: anthranilate synthase component I [Phycisphaerales bacterium]
MIRPNFETFRGLARPGTRVALYRRIFSDQLTPVLAYRRLVAADEREAPSFLLESVEGGDRQGRFSFVGAQPALEVVARRDAVEVIDHEGDSSGERREGDPLAFVRRLVTERAAVCPEGLPAGFSGGWVGYAGYDTVRYAEPGKLPFDAAPADDRGLPDLALGLYRQMAIFDHVRKMVFAVQWVEFDEGGDLRSVYDGGARRLDEFVERLQTHSVPLPAGSIDLALRERGEAPAKSNLSRGDFETAVERAKAHILAGDIFQVVLSQRFERETTADPFEIYRALRIVNPSPYMIYLQARGSILVASSPEILCRVRDGVVVNRPLAGTRRRGANEDEDVALERELLADEKERAEHIMLVDLGRNDVGRVAERGTVEIERSLEVERYSHVMHISSTVTGALAAGRDCWDALRAALPVGTVSGAPKIRAMQIIDELEPTRRGPYGGGIGFASFTGDMDMALALRTMVIPIDRCATELDGSRRWTVHLQAGAGIVADSVPAKEYEETVSKAAGLGRAIDLAESAFREADRGET